MRESAVESVFRARVRDLGGLSFKFAPIHAGNPDQIAILPGGVVKFVELKADDGALHAAQLLWHRRALERGVVVDVVQGSGEARLWLPT